MLETVVGAIAPIVITILLGFVAGWRHDENAATAKPINTMVLRYALPLALFAATVANPRDKLLSQGPLALILLVGILVPAAIAFTVRYLISHDMNAAVLQGLGFGFPAISVCRHSDPYPIDRPSSHHRGGSRRMHHQSAAGAAGLCPVVSGKGKQGGGSASQGAQQNGKASQNAKQDSKGGDGKDNPSPPPSVGGVILHSLEQPVVWAPVCGLVLILLGVPFPKVVQTGIKFLGSTAGAVSLFASGIILQAQKPTISWPIAISTLGRNLVIPGTAFLVLKLLHVDHQLLKTAVLALAMPAAAMQITLALAYDTGQQENASFLLYSNLLSIVTVALVIAVVK